MDRGQSSNPSVGDKDEEGKRNRLLIAGIPPVC
jgi:hypothetical protein